LAVANGGTTDIGRTWQQYGKEVLAVLAHKQPATFFAGRSLTGQGYAY